MRQKQSIKIGWNRFRCRVASHQSGVVNVGDRSFCNKTNAITQQNKNTKKTIATANALTCTKRRRELKTWWRCWWKVWRRPRTAPDRKRADKQEWWFLHTTCSQYHALHNAYRVLPNSSTRPSAEPNLLVALHTYCPYWRFSIVITLTVVSVSSSAVAKCDML